MLVVGPGGNQVFRRPGPQIEKVANDVLREALRFALEQNALALSSWIHRLQVIGAIHS